MENSIKTLQKNLISLLSVLSDLEICGMEFFQPELKETDALPFDDCRRFLREYRGLGRKACKSK